MKRLVLAILISVLTPSWASSQTVLIPEKAERDRFITLKLEGDFDRAAWFVRPPSRKAKHQYEQRDGGKTLLLVGSPGEYELFVVASKGETLVPISEVLTIVDTSGPAPGPVPPPDPTPGPTPGPTPDPVVPDDPDIIVVNPLGSEVSKGATGAPVVPAAEGLIASVILDKQTSTFATLSLYTSPAVDKVMKDYNGLQRNYEDSQAETLTALNLQAWVQKYPAPCVVWQRGGSKAVVAITKNPTEAKILATAKLLRGAR